MAETKKMTKKEIINDLIDVLRGDKEVDDVQIFVDYLLNERAILEKKAQYKGTSKTQVENTKVKEMLVQELINIGKPITITELMEQSPVVANYVLENGNKLSNQKITALFTQMVVDNTIVRTTEKRKSYFSVGA